MRTPQISTEECANTNVSTNTTKRHDKAHAYFEHDAAETMRNECNRFHRGAWRVTECELCAHKYLRAAFHVESEQFGFLCL
jgi:hypothetical protein